MITDWFRTPDTWVLAPLAVALACALLLALTRRALPPGNPEWRVRRAIVVCAAMSVWPFLLQIGAPYIRVWWVLGPEQPRAILASAAFLAGGGVVLGWLIPWLIEGRSLAGMGWVARRAVLYLLAGIVVGSVAGLLLHPRPWFGPLDEIVPPQRGLALLPLLSVGFIVPCALYGLLAGWAEENVFRGHLMPALVERGYSRGGANLLQAAGFALYHVPALLAAVWRRETGYPLLPYLLIATTIWFVWGLLFGLLRLRTRSIVPGFALHAAYDAVYLMMVWGPMAAMLGGLRP